MNRANLIVRIMGEGVVPATVGIGDLTEFLIHVENAIIAGITVDVPGTGTNSTPSIDNDPIVSLIGVDKGSNCLTLSVAAKARAGTASVIKSIESKDWNALPIASHREMHELYKHVCKKNWEIEIPKNRSLKSPRALISAANPVPEPTTPFISGSTTVFGKCVRVGGAARPAALIRPTNRPDLLTVQVSEQMAKQLALRLYEDVAIKGEAIWETENWRIVDFVAKEVQQYAPSSLLQAFDELAEAAQGQWADVDAEKFVQELRAED